MPLRPIRDLCLTVGLKPFDPRPTPRHAYALREPARKCLPKGDRLEIWAALMRELYGDGFELAFEASGLPGTIEDWEHERNKFIREHESLDLRPKERENLKALVQRVMDNEHLRYHAKEKWGKRAER